MEQKYNDIMANYGYNELVTDIFVEWEDVKDEILPQDRKSGSGNGTIHVFLGAGDAVLRQEFPAYYDAVKEGEDPSVHAIEVKHVFLPSNVLSMLGYVCQYYSQKGESFENEVNSILHGLEAFETTDHLLVTSSYLKLSVGSSKLRPYFKQFKSDGVFTKLIRRILLPNSAYKISLYKSSEGKYAAFWLIGSNSLSNFESDSDSTQMRRIRKNIEQYMSYSDYFTAIRTKPFMLLAGISGTGKSRIVREFAFASCPKELQDKDSTTPGNYCMIEVKPNWHDSSELLGYYSNISKKYNYTKFVKFLVKAMKHQNTPFFVCLDEMNLAPVEQYFAEFLSVLETRKKNGEHIVSGALVDKKFFLEIYEMDGETKKVINSKPSDQVWYDYFWKDKKDDEDDASTMTGEDAPEYGATYNLMEKGLTLPDNVFIIGTVNMDDTTHQFSRKVIDRAMTIEMNGGELSKMFGGSDALTYPEDDVLDMDAFRADYVNADEVIAKHKDLEGLITTKMPDMLDKINDILENTPFQVSYRVLNELVIYLGVLIDDAIKKGETVDESNFLQYATTALDAILLMKILPRIEGDSDMFYMKEEKSIEIAGEGDETEQVKSKNRLELLKAIAPANSQKKIEEMLSRLNTTEFTRFWP